MSALRELLAAFHVTVEDKELKEAHEHVEAFKETLRTVGSAVAEAFAVHEVLDFVKEQVEAGAQLKVTAERLGTTTTELQALQLAAGQAGVSSEALSTGLRFLNRNIAEAQKGSGEQAEIFRKLGISLTDAAGQSRPAGDVFGDLATALSGTEDAAKKTQISMALFGRSGAELIPLLNQGGDAIKAARTQLEELGGGLGTDFVEKAHEAEGANVRLNFAMKGLKSEIALALFPAVKELVSELTKITAEAVKLEKETGALSTATEFFAVVAGLKAIGTLKDLGVKMGLLKPSILETIGALAGFAGPLVALAVLYLLVDDLIGLFKGNDTLIGRMLGPDKQAFIDNVRESVRQLSQAFDDVVRTAYGVGYEVLALDQALEPLGTVTSVQDLSRDFRELGALVAGATENMRHLIEAAMHMKNMDFGAPLEDLKGTSVGRLVPSNPTRFGLGNMFNQIAGLPPQRSPGEGLDMADEANARTRSDARIGARAPLSDPMFLAPRVYFPANGGDRARGGGDVNVTMNNNTKIDISGSGDPATTARKVGSQIATENQRNMNHAKVKLRRP